MVNLLSIKIMFGIAGFTIKTGLIHINPQVCVRSTPLSVAHTHTLDKNGSLYDPAGTESCDMQIRLVSYLDKDEYMCIYIYI